MKLRLMKIGNSQGVILPKSTLNGYNIGDEIDIVITKKDNNVITKPEVITADVITKDYELIDEKEDWAENMKEYE